MSDQTEKLARDMARIVSAEAESRLTHALRNITTAAESECKELGISSQYFARTLLYVAAMPADAEYYQREHARLHSAIFADLAKRMAQSVGQPEVE